MSNNDNNIEKRSFEAFVNAIGSEIEQAQVRLISAANAQMLFHYWKMGNYILYHQNLQGWGGKVIKKLAQAIRFNYPEKKDIRSGTWLICASSHVHIHWVHYGVSSKPMRN